MDPSKPPPPAVLGGYAEEADVRAAGVPSRADLSSTSEPTDGISPAGTTQPLGAGNNNAQLYRPARRSIDRDAQPPMLGSHFERARRASAFSYLPTRESVPVQAPPDIRPAEVRPGAIRAPTLVEDHVGQSSLDSFEEGRVRHPRRRFSFNLQPSALSRFDGGRNVDTGLQQPRAVRNGGSPAGLSARESESYRPTTTPGELYQSAETRGSDFDDGDPNFLQQMGAVSDDEDQSESDHRSISRSGGPDAEEALNYASNFDAASSADDGSWRPPSNILSISLGARAANLEMADIAVRGYKSHQNSSSIDSNSDHFSSTSLESIENISETKDSSSQDRSSSGSHHISGSIGATDTDELRRPSVAAPKEPPRSNLELSMDIVCLTQNLRRASIEGSSDGVYPTPRPVPRPLTKQMKAEKAVAWPLESSSLGQLAEISKTKARRLSRHETRATRLMSQIRLISLARAKSISHHDPQASRPKLPTPSHHLPNGSSRRLHSPAVFPFFNPDDTSPNVGSLDIDDLLATQHRRSTILSSSAFPAVSPDMMARGEHLLASSGATPPRRSLRAIFTRLGDGLGSWPRTSSGPVFGGSSSWVALPEGAGVVGGGDAVNGTEIKAPSARLGPALPTHKLHQPSRLRQHFEQSSSTFSFAPSISSSLPQNEEEKLDEKPAGPDVDATLVRSGEGPPLTPNTTAAAEPPPEPPATSESRPNAKHVKHAKPPYGAEIPALNPDGDFVSLWDFCMTGPYLSVLFIVPFVSAYSFPAQSIIGYSVALSVLFSADTVVRAFTRDEFGPRTAFAALRHNAGTLAFWMDVLTSVPVVGILAAAGQLSSGLALTPAMTARFLVLIVLRLYRLGRVIRSRAVVAVTTHVWEALNIGIRATAAMYGVRNVLIYWHLLSCLYLFIGTASGFRDPWWASSMVKAELGDASKWNVFFELPKSYTFGIWTAVQNTLPMTSDFLPTGMGMQWTFFGLALGSAIISAALTGAVTAYYADESGSPASIYSRKMSEVHEYVSAKALSNELRRKIDAGFYRKYRGALFDEEDILAGLNPSLREEVCLQNCRHILESVDFFRMDKSDSRRTWMHRVLSTGVRQVVFLEKAAVYNQYDYGTTMFLLVSGYAVVKVGDIKVGYLTPNSFFGELNLVSPGPRVETIEAVTLLTCVEVSDHVVRLIADTIPEVAARIEAFRQDRLRLLMRLADGGVASTRPATEPATPNSD
ncbi:anaphase-promoting complex subunit Hcn1 [Cladochytrium tenue]|nr:anaphase-promoting complex subunit Hcn1 [Cladochytrium tenue]